MISSLLTNRIATFYEAEQPKIWGAPGFWRRLSGKFPQRPTAAARGRRR